MESKEVQKKLQQLTEGKVSGFAEKARKRKAERKSWTSKSKRIAGEILSELRVMGWTQKRLAERMDVKPQYINKMLKGNENFTLETIDRINQAFGKELISFSFKQYENKKPLENELILKEGKIKITIAKIDSSSANRSKIIPIDRKKTENNPFNYGEFERNYHIEKQTA